MSRKIIHTLLSLVLLFSNSTLIWAKPLNLNDVSDVLVTTDGAVHKGEIVKFSVNSVKIRNANGLTKIKNNRISIIGINQELTDAEKYQLGILDGKRYAKNKGGNLAVGFFLGLIGTAVVYLSSEQLPSQSLVSNENNLIVNDIYYIRGYEKGSRKKSTTNALLGAITSTVAVTVYALNVWMNLDDN